MGNEVRKVYVEAKPFGELQKGELFFTKRIDAAKDCEYVFDRIENDEGINKLYSSTCGGYWTIDDLESCVDYKFWTKVSTNKWLVY